MNDEGWQVPQHSWDTVPRYVDTMNAVVEPGKRAWDTLTAEMLYKEGC